MKPLEEYVFRDEQGKDQGINGEGETKPHCVNKHCENILMSYSLTCVCVCVSLPVCLVMIRFLSASLLPLLPPSVRQKAKEIIAFLQDDERLREARKQAKQTRDKYVGYSSEEVQYKYSKYSQKNCTRSRQPLSLISASSPLQVTAMTQNLAVAPAMFPVPLASMTLTLTDPCRGGWSHGACICVHVVYAGICRGRGDSKKHMYTVHVFHCTASIPESNGCMVLLHVYFEWVRVSGTAL